MYLTHNTSITTENQEEFQPTFLYIKQHAITGKLYFGKTCKSHDEMLTYLGSGTYWGRHIRKHGKEHVTTLWYCLFTNRDDCVDFATNFSIQENIVESKDWANMREENGTDGNPTGVKFSDETNAKKARWGSDNGMYGKKQLVETIEKSKRTNIERFGVENIFHLPEYKELASKKKKGTANAKDAVTGEILGRISTADTRWASGEIVGQSRGRVSDKPKKEKVIKPKKTHYTPEEIAARTGWRQTEDACRRISETHTGSGNSQFGTTYMVNHETKEKTRIHKSRVNELQEKGWVIGNKHAYTYVKLGVLLL